MTTHTWGEIGAAAKHQNSRLTNSTIVELTALAKTSQRLLALADVWLTKDGVTGECNCAEAELLADIIDSSVDGPLEDTWFSEGVLAMLSDYNDVELEALGPMLRFVTAGQRECDDYPND